MKKAIAIMASIFALLWVFLGLIWAALLTSVLVIIVLAIRKTLKRYGRRLENIYVWQQSPDDKKVIVRARQHERWIHWSGNDMGIKVVTIIFQDSLNPTEIWEEYLVRVKETIAADKAERHQYIERTEGREYYLREMHGQRGIRLEGDQPHWLIGWITRKIRRA